MTFGFLRLGLAVVWVCVAAGVYFRDRLADDAPGGGDSNVDLIALVALALAGWNLVRFFASARRPADDAPPARRPLGARLDRDADRPEEYNPEFDFTRRPPTDRGKN